VIGATRFAAVVLVALALAPAAAGAADGSLIERGNQQWAAGRLDDARKSFEQAAAESPRAVEPHMKLAGLQLSSRNFPGAIKSYQQAITLDGHNAKAWVGLGLAYLHSGQRELARAAFEEAQSADASLKPRLAAVVQQLDP
jgi:tetratricopeptide (TPR) repeat protein